MMKKFLPIISVSLISVLILSACTPSGNIVGSADFVTYISNIADSGSVGSLSINGGMVATPSGIRARLTKFNLSIPASGVYLTANKFNGIVDNTYIPRSKFAADRLKGKNVCASTAGFLQNGSPFTAAIFGDPTSNNHAIVLETPDIFIVANSENDNLNIGGRNLCGNW